MKKTENKKPSSKPKKQEKKKKIEKPKEPKPYPGKGPIRAKILEGTVVKNYLNVGDGFRLGEFIQLSEAEFYDLQGMGGVELSKGQQKVLAKRKARSGFLNIDEKDLDYFLSGTDEPSKRLGQGVHNNEFYYCVNTNNGYALITSERHFFPVFEKTVIDGTKASKITVDGIKEDFEMEYTGSFEGKAVDTGWEKKSELQFLKNEAKPKTTKEIYDLILEQSKKHVWHPDEKHHGMIAAFIQSTYCFELFETAPRLNFFALTESGKSTASKVIKYSCFNPVWFSRASPASLFRSVEATCSVPIIDNFDKLPDELKETIFHFIETSFDREGCYRLCEASQKNWVTRTFFTFCPMVINSTMAFEDAALENRCILVRMEKTENKYKKINPKDSVWKNIRNDCRIWVLENWKKIEKTRDEIIENENRLKDRAIDIWLPLLTIAKMAGEYENLMALAIEKTHEQKEFSEGESFARELTVFLLEKIGDAPSDKFELGQLATDYGLENCSITDEQERERYASRKRRMFLKMIKNFLKTQPSLWKRERITRPKNRETVEIFKEDLEKIGLIRGYIPKMNNELTLLNQPNLPNLSSPNLTQKGYDRLSRVKKVKSVKSENGTPTLFKKNEKTQVLPLEKCEICLATVKKGEKYCDQCKANLEGVE